MLKEKLEFDIAVCGGGTAGVCAAISAARNGSKTVLIERNQFLGGMMVSGLGLLGYKDRLGKSIIGGIAQEIIDELDKTQDSQGHNYCPILNSLTPVNTAMMQLILLKKCKEAGVTVLLSCEVNGIEKKDKTIVSVDVIGTYSSFSVRAKVFIDGTGDGELSNLSGVEMVHHDSDGELQPASLIFALSNVDREPLLSYLEQNPDEAKTPEGYEMDTSPEFYRQSVGYNVLGLDALIRKARENGDYRDVPRDRFSTITNPISDRMTINNTRIMNFNGADLFQLNNGISEGYRQLKELLDFIPKYVPGYEKSNLTSISPMMGVRESRRCCGIKTLTSNHVLNGDVPEDTIALCGYNIDIHHGADEGSDLYIVKKAYGIPYGTMISDRVSNLLFTGRLISVDSDTFGSARIMSTCMVLGEAAGCAASMCAVENCLPAEVDVAELRRKLVSANVVLEV